MNKQTRSTDNPEKLIWDQILTSAKRKFDYQSFENKFKKIDQEVPENLLAETIAGLASYKTEEDISYDLHIEMLLKGILWDPNEIQYFVSDTNTLFRDEIFAAQIANTLLEKGEDPVSVLRSVSSLTQ